MSDTGLTSTNNLEHIGLMRKLVSNVSLITADIKDSLSKASVINIVIAMAKR